MNQKYLLVVVFLGCSIAFSQPYVDLASVTYQTFSAPYKTPSFGTNKTDLLGVNLLLPKPLKSGNTILCRIVAENIHSEIISNNPSSSQLSSFSVAFGYQWWSSNQHWKTILMGIPKWASDLKDPITAKDWQYGALAITKYQLNAKVHLKAGLYYNREAFGNFFIPLLGIDWKASERLNFYGILPSNYTVEYQFIPKKGYAGVAFTAPTRSFHLSKSQQEDYVRIDEVTAKFFANYELWNHLVLIGEVGYSLGKSPLQYTTATDRLSQQNPIYTPLKRYPVFGIGLAYRIREDVNSNQKNTIKD